MTRRRKQRGSQIVELAVVLPLLLLLVFGAADGGSMVHVHQVVNNAAREGARIAAIQVVGTATNRNAVIQKAVNDYMSNNGILPTSTFTFGQCNSWNQATNVTVTNNTFQIDDPVQSSGKATLQTTQVTVTCPYKFFLLSKISSFGVAPATVTLRGSATMLNNY
ncbi:MAG TPA: TadE/TadG family type IV pilus assembly protein [Terriglobales bacterium]|nr:TadE/TadG family type IV pilus assembly protein [Terriglobales bacterium]